MGIAVLIPHKWMTLFVIENHASEWIFAYFNFSFPPMFVVNVVPIKQLVVINYM